MEKKEGGRKLNSILTIMEPIIMNAQYNEPPKPCKIA